MHPADCPEWEYATNPRAGDVLLREAKSVLLRLRRDLRFTLEVGKDSRPTHDSLFKDLTPPGYRYFAGCYRGEAYRCLKDYPVGVPADPRVGTKPAEVYFAMQEFGRELIEGIAALDEASVLPEAQLSKKNKLYFAVVLASRAFAQFLTIHPFANGNGHIARILVTAIVGRFGYWPRRWPIEPRPADPNYSPSISAYRDGNYQILENFILKCILGRP